MEAINKVRSFRFLDNAVVDLIASFAFTAGLGLMLPEPYASNMVFNGLMSVPISIVTHKALGVNTPLTDFVFSGSPHLIHAFMIGFASGALSEVFGVSHINATNMALSTTILSTMYMKEYDHDLPKPVKKKMMKLMMRYQRWKNSK